MKTWEPENPFREYEKEEGSTPDSDALACAFDEAVQATVRSVVEWLMGDCLEHSRFMDTEVSYRKRYECASCWQELRQGLEGE